MDHSNKKYTMNSKSHIHAKIKYFNYCRAEYTKMPRPLLIFSQSDYLVQIVDTNSHT